MLRTFRGWLLGGLLLAGMAPGPGLPAAQAGSCLANGCHQTLGALRYLHGPVAAEQAGARGCVMCHQPDGAACTTDRAGSFVMASEGMCLQCHDQGTGTQHSAAKSDCLQCHDPHGSATSPYLVRSDR